MLGGMHAFDCRNTRLVLCINPGHNRCYILRTDADADELRFGNSEADRHQRHSLGRHSRKYTAELQSRLFRCGRWNRHIVRYLREWNILWRRHGGNLHGMLSYQRQCDLYIICCGLGGEYGVL